MPIVDVRNVAEAHVNAIQKGVNGARYLMCCQDDFLSFKEIADILNQEFKGTNYKIPTSEAPYYMIWMMSFCDNRSKMYLPVYGKQFYVDQKRVTKELEVDYISLEDSLKSFVHNLIDIKYFEDRRIKE